MEEVCLLGLLGICSIEDVKYKKLRIMVLLGFGVWGLMLHMIEQSFSMYLLLGGMGIGGSLMIISLLTKGKIGLGDGTLLMISGIYIGLWNNIFLLILSLGLAGVVGLMYLLFHKYKASLEIPFVPYVLIAYVVVLFSEGGKLI